MSIQIMMMRVGLLAAALALSACASTTIKPAVGKNFTLTEVHPDNNSIAGLIMEDASDARASHFQEKDELMQSQDEAVLRWRQGLDALKNKAPLEQLSGLNELVNRSVNYKDDYQHWRRIDRWGHSVETLKEGGDCEDFAILKAESMLSVGRATALRCW